MTPRKIWDRKRNMVIAMAKVYGASERFIADVFDLPHSRIHVILDQLKSEVGGDLTREWVAAELEKLSTSTELGRMRKASSSDWGKEMANLKKRKNSST